jgi:hypothetical protein
MDTPSNNEYSWAEPQHKQQHGESQQTPPDVNKTPRDYIFFSDAMVGGGSHHQRNRYRD